MLTATDCGCRRKKESMELLAADQKLMNSSLECSSHLGSHNLSSVSQTVE